MSLASEPAAIVNRLPTWGRSGPTVASAIVPATVWHMGQAPAIRVIGHQWWWEVEYLVGELPQHFHTANELHVPVGQPVDVELVTADVIHSFWVPRLHGKVDMVPGLRNHIRIQAAVPG